MAKSKGGNTVETVWKIAEPIASELGLSIWDVRFEKEGANWYLRIYIDKDGGVSIDDCVDMSHAIDKPLDDADPIEQSYCLEVCSPGVERELKRDSHFEKSIGQPIMVKLIRPIDSQRDFNGTLESYDNGNFELRLEDGTRLMINKKETSYVKLDDFGGVEEW
ncbi:MAG: ribosome maturation factor RimP [Clostridia bacterium]|nr:ribosome maturation factor RimP [Clostridia bacterium]